MDLAEGHFRALDYLFMNSPVNIKLNLGTGKGISVIELIETFKRVNNVRIPFTFSKRRHGDRGIVYADNSLAKELLGIIRSKYSSMPIPDGEVTLDGEGLKTEGREEKTQLLEELKEFLESVSLTEKLKAEAEEANAQQEVLAKAPLPIFIG